MPVLNYNHIVLHQNSKIGVFLSGGLDSAILSALILRQIKDEKLNIEITFLIVNKNDNTNNVKDVNDFLKKRYEVEFKLKLDVQNIGSEYGAISSAIRSQMDSSEFDYIYTGVNQNPPKSIVILKGTYPKRPVSNPHKKLILPFMNLYKNQIVEMAIRNDLSELFLVTYSCTQQPINPCKECFSCDERAWGFKVNNVLDPSL